MLDQALAILRQSMRDGQGYEACDNAMSELVRAAWRYVKTYAPEEAKRLKEEAEELKWRRGAKVTIRPSGDDDISVIERYRRNYGPE